MENPLEQKVAALEDRVKYLEDSQRLVTGELNDLRASINRIVWTKPAPAPWSPPYGPPYIATSG